jgi:hypothetical protein
MNQLGMTHTIPELKELEKNSTQVVGWYAHPGQVRGPFCRWFEVTQVAPQYEKHVATQSDDAAYCAAAMNNLPHVIQMLERADKALGVAMDALRKQGLQSVIRKMEDIIKNG